MIGEYDAQAETAGPVRTRERRTVRLVAGLTAVVLAILGFASYQLVAGAGHTGKPAASSKTAAAASVPSTPSAQAVSPSASASSASSASASPSAVAAQALKPVSAAAFGPGGTADGDGAAQTGYAIDGSMATDWRTDWYSTPLFGGLQAGTGLLLDMGRTLTIAGVQVTLGTERGANFQIRAGNTAALAGLPPAAAASGASGTVTLKLAKPVTARYVLLWFTALPPDGVGTYQAQVYNVGVTGQP